MSNTLRTMGRALGHSAEDEEHPHARIPNAAVITARKRAAEAIRRADARKVARRERKSAASSG